MKQLALSTTLVVLLAACGGGGGGGAPAPAPPAVPAAIQINASNAQAVAAHATDSTQNTSTEGAATLATGVQIETGTSAKPSNLLIADAVTFLAQSAATSSTVATGVAINRTVACQGGGTVTAAGDVAVSNALTVGDNVTVSAANCVATINGATATINGALGIRITGGGLTSGASTFHVVMTLTASNFSVRAGNESGVLDGDLTIDLTRSSATSASLVITGKSLSTSESTASGTRSSTWTGYRQGLSSNGSSVAATLDATILVTGTRLPIANGSYQIASPTPVRWSNGSAPTSGVVVVTGAANSRLRITFTPTGVNLEVDSGNGVFGAPTTTTFAALEALL